MSVAAYYVDEGKAYPLQYDYIRFPGGEPHVQIHHYWEVAGNHILIDYRGGDSNDFLHAMLLANAMRNLKVQTLELFIPYFPGARQDRVERHSGFGFTAQMYASIVNQYGFDTIYILDPHSDVIGALLSNVYVMDPTDPLLKAIFCRVNKPDYIISPDAGAEKRAQKVATTIGIPYVRAWKKRNPIDGRLSGFGIDQLPASGSYLVVDDICDGGGTFNGLAEVFRNTPKGLDSSLALWVSHGIFSQGFDKLLKSYKEIYTTDSFPQSDWNAKVHVEPVFPYERG